MNKIMRVWVLFLAYSIPTHAQTYADSIQSYIDTYVKGHEVVKGEDKKFFRFFPVNDTFRVLADFKKATESRWLMLTTSGPQKKAYRVYGTLTFTIHDTALKLNLYQAENLLSDPAYKNYLLLMFTDLTTGRESYDGGRYLDFTTSDIKDGQLAIDFNKAYNPYCAYVKGKYNCPIPPAENNLPVAIEAGEKTFKKTLD